MNNNDKLYGESVGSNAIALKLDLKLEARLKDTDVIIWPWNTNARDDLIDKKKHESN